MVVVGEVWGQCVKIQEKEKKLPDSSSKTLFSRQKYLPGRLGREGKEPMRMYVCMNVGVRVIDSP